VNIQEICAENGITDNDVIFDITKNTGYVFLGLLSPNELSNILEKELKIEKKIAEQVASKITRFVFLPVKKNLEALYQIKMKAETKTKTKETEEVKNRPKRKDRYRETIE